MDVVGGFESTYLPRHDVDVTETTGHHERVADDLDLAAGDLGLRWLRYPVRWHRVEARRGRYDWDHTDRVLDALRARPVTPILDLLHHTSYPRWLARGLGDRRFAESYLAFVTAVAERYGWVGGVTLMNEPFGTAWLAGHEGVWPPHRRGPGGLVRVLERTLPALAEASRRWAELAPGARHFHTETAEAHTADPRLDPASGPARHATMADARRFVATDLLVGRAPDPAAADWLARAGGERLLALAPGRVDVLGLDYYAHHEWWYGADGGRSPSPRPRGLARVATEYAARHPGLDLWVGETNVRGFVSDRCTWLRHTVDQCERAIAAGAPITAYCWYPTIDSADWDSLLTRADGHLDPVGIYWLDERRNRRVAAVRRLRRPGRRRASRRPARLPAVGAARPRPRRLRRAHGRRRVAGSAAVTGATIDLTLGDFGSGLPAALRDVMARAAAEPFGYPPPRGSAALRGAVVAWARRRHGLELDPDSQVLSSNGSKEAVYHLAAAVAGPRRDPERRLVLHPDPGYQVYAPSARDYGLEPRGVDPALATVTDEDLGRSALVWVNSPHNPTGVTLSPDALARLADRCRRAGVLLASDEPYTDTYDDGTEPPASLLEAAGVDGVVALVSLSKRSGLTGLRSGAILGDPAWIARLAAQRVHTGSGTPHFVQAAAAAAWADDATLAPMRTALTAKRAALAPAVAALGIPALPASAGLYLWCDCGSPGAADALRARLADEAGVLVQPGAVYGASSARFVRFALTATVEATVEAARRIEALAR